MLDVKTMKSGEMVTISRKRWALISLLFFAVCFIAAPIGEYGISIMGFILGMITLVVSTSKPDNSVISTKYQSQSSKVSKYDIQNNFENLGWRQMEELTGELFRKKGYSVELTPSTGDYGIDVWAKKDGMIIGIQVKKWRNDVGFDDVAKTLGSNLSKANKYILISTTSFFTPQAWEHQRQHSTIIELWDTNRFKKELSENLGN
jgi:HJR/Mrr/RecB family endonuclease